MRGISMSSRTRSGGRLARRRGSRAPRVRRAPGIAFQPAFFTAIDSTWRMLSESSTMSTVYGACSAARRVGCESTTGSSAAPTRSAGLRIRTTVPSPSSVAPQIPGTRRRCVPSVFTTASRLLTISSTASGDPPPRQVGNEHRLHRGRRRQSAQGQACRRGRASGYVLPSSVNTRSAPTRLIAVGCGRTICTTAPSGRPNVSPPARTSRTRVMASVIGTRTEIVVPAPGRDVTIHAAAQPRDLRPSRRPCRRRGPRPRLTCSAVLKPGSKMNDCTASAVMPAASASVT